ncbi:MAG: alcohol dehydrogenase catalytic domain-containing protein [Ilumatobacteraceae bacterium]
MKTVVARRGSDQPIVAELDTQVVGPDEVRVAVTAAAFTYFDAFVAAHHDSLGLPEQVGLGFDFSGIVAEVGSRVSALAIGDRVAGLHVDITAAVRAHSQEVVIDAGALAVVPVEVDLAVAAAVPLSALTAHQALDLLGPDRGRLLVTGAAGAVGGWLTELAAREGWHVTALVKPGTATRPRSANVVITELSGSYDAVLDAAALHAPALAAVRDDGRYVGFKPGDPQTPERGVIVGTVQVVADGAALGVLLDLAAKGAVPVHIAGRTPLPDAAAAYANGAASSGSRGRWLLIP